MAKQQKTTIKINKRYSAIERKAIAQDIIDYIQERTIKKGHDKNGRSMGTYSKSYKNSTDFKQKRNKSMVNLQLSGDMLTRLGEYTKDRAGAITIGYDKGGDINGQVEGNRKGTYGNKLPVTKPRDFLGVSQNALKKILSNYPLNSERKRAESTAISLLAEAEAAAIVKQLQDGEITTAEALKRAREESKDGDI